jgi:hypothetical protein
VRGLHFDSTLVYCREHVTRLGQGMDMRGREVVLAQAQSRFRLEILQH